MSVEITGEYLQAELERALSARQKQREVEAYSDYERRATTYMVRREAMPESELADPCNFQCRACGWNPYQPKIRRWFWALHIEQRRTLVRLSRAMKVTFWRGGEF